MTKMPLSPGGKVNPGANLEMRVLEDTDFVNSEGGQIVAAAMAARMIKRFGEKRYSFGPQRSTECDQIKQLLSSVRFWPVGLCTALDSLRDLNVKDFDDAISASRSPHIRSLQEKMKAYLQWRWENRERLAKEAAESLRQSRQASCKHSYKHDDYGYSIYMTCIHCGHVA